MKIDNIVVLGLGYIGLPTAATFASMKKHVIGVDIQEAIVDSINQGKVHISETDLDSLVEEAVENGYLSASLEPQEADVFIITVPTPFTEVYRDDKIFFEPDLSYIKASVIGIAPVIKKGDLIVLESTSPVGTTEKISTWLSKERPDLLCPNYSSDDTDINIAYCPERVIPGNILSELIENDRVIGGITKKCSERGAELYKVFLQGECLLTNSRTAEMVKLTENSSRDVQIAFANELSMICDSLDIDVWELIQLSNHHPRVNILQPGPGVGGHCIAVDPWFIVSKSPDEANLIRLAREVNDFKPMWVVERIKEVLSNLVIEEDFSGKKDITLACYGLTFKANIDDVRESPSILIIQQLKKLKNCKIVAIEPNINFPPKQLEDIQLVDTDFAMENADIHILLVDHDDFKELNMSGKIFIDTKGIWR